MNTIIKRNCRFLVGIISIGMLNLLPLHGQNFDFKCASNSDIENSDAYKVGNMFQKDLLLFLDLLKQSHPAFAPGSDFPFNIDSVVSEGYQWASQCRSINELKSYLQVIATLLHDGHTALQPDINKNLVYPFVFFKDNRNIYLTAVNKEHDSFLGKQISQINGYPAEEVLNSFKQVISSDNEIYFLDNVNDYMQLYSSWQGNPYCLPDSSLQLTFVDATSVSLYPISAKEINIARIQTQTSSNSIRQNSKQPFLYKLLPEKKICYLQFNTCTDQSSLRSQYYMSNSNNLSEEELEKRLSQYPRFDAFLTEMFQTIQANEIETLIIDVRNNGGGNSKLCDVLLSWLKPLKEIKQGNSSIRFSELWEQHYPALAAEYKQALEENQQSYERGKLYDNSFLSQLSKEKEKTSVYEKIDSYFMKNEDENKVFRGNVVFIQDTKTYSSAGLLITDATDNHIGIVIGNKSSYKPCHYGDLLAYELPHTKIRGFVSHKIFNRPDTKRCNEASLIPVAYIPDNWSDVLEGRDIYWEWVLEHYGK
jgi:hypothetical protein